jgi:hypothetical protein
LDSRILRDGAKLTTATLAVAPRLQPSVRTAAGGHSPRKREEHEEEDTNYAYAAPTMIFLILMYGEPCEMLLVCVG